MNWITIFTYIPYAFFALTMATFVIPLKLKVRAQAIWSMALLVCFSKFLCFAAFGGHAFNPDLPAAVIWAWDWLYSGAMILSALGLLTVFFRFRAKLWVLPVLAWGLAAWGLYNGFSVPAVHEVELTYSDLPPSLDGYRIVQLSDLHCSSAARRWRTEAVVEKTNALRPDLAVVSGDMCHRAANLERDWPSLLRRFDVPVVFTPGNHDLGNEVTAENLSRFRKVFGRDRDAFCFIAQKQQHIAGLDAKQFSGLLGDHNLPLLTYCGSPCVKAFGSVHRHLLRMISMICMIFYTIETGSCQVPVLQVCLLYKKHTSFRIKR